MSIDAGELRHRVGILKPTRGKDSGGGPTVEFGVAVGRWADVRIGGGREQDAAGQTVGGNSGTVRVRWEDAFQEAGTDWRIEYRGRLYDIVSSVNVGEENELIEFEVAAVPSEPVV